MSDDPTAYEYTTRRITTGASGDREINQLTKDGWEITDRSAPKGRITVVTFRRSKEWAAKKAAHKAALDRHKRETEQKRRDALSPEQRKHEDTRNIVVFAVVAVVVVGLIVLGIVNSGGDKKEPTSPASLPTSTAPSAPPNVIVPDVTGLSLNTAKDQLYDAGLFALVADCSGRGRNVLRDKNWFVLSQSPLAGTSVKQDSDVQVCVLKYED